MTYKDKEKQKQAQRERTRRYRDKQKGVTSEGVTTEPSIAEFDKIADMYGIENYGQPDCMCMHCQSKRTNNSKLLINHGPHKRVNELQLHEVNRVSLPGDSDYAGVAINLSKSASMVACGLIGLGVLGT